MRHYPDRSDFHLNVLYPYGAGDSGCYVVACMESIPGDIPDGIEALGALCASLKDEHFLDCDLVDALHSAMGPRSSIDRVEFLYLRKRIHPLRSERVWAALTMDDAIADAREEGSL